MICAGIDAGSRTIKVVLLESDDLTVVASGVQDQGLKQADLASQLVKKMADTAGIGVSNIRSIVATGYGRDAISNADRTVTEITCHARGVSHQVPAARTVIDIGGQDSKLLRLEPGGGVRDFVVNDRCAAGTGRFLEVVAARLEVDLDSLGDMMHRATNPASISNMCVVFAETEIIGLLASGETPDNIVAGVEASIASRIASMAGRKVDEPTIFTGGVALISGMSAAIETALGHPVTTSPNPQLTGALGAALFAAEKSGR